jgi:putative ABC transport system permease protein
MSGIAGRLAREHPETNRGVGVRLGLIRDEIVGNVRPMLLLLMAAVVFVLLIACANVANLLSVRSVIRRKEFAIRLALGAGRKRLVRQLLVESVLLALLGGLCGLLIAIWSTRFLVGLIPGNLLVNLPLSEHVTLDWRVLAFNFLFATLTGVLVGLVPARQSFRVSGMETLKEGEQWSMGGKQKELGSLLVVSEVALLLVLLAGTGLVLTSLQRLLQVDPGFRLDQLLTMGISLPETKYTEPAQVAQFYQELLRRVAAAPGVKEVAMIDELPLTNDRISTHLYVPGQARPAPGLEQGAVWRTVSPNYFQCAGIPLLRGRPFTPHDDASAGLAVILSKELARRLFDVEDPIGRQVRMISDGSLRQVVGVVGDVKLGALDRPALPALYTSNLQEPSNTNDLVIQARILPAELSNTVRRLAQELDSELPARSIRTMSEIVQSSPAVSIRRSTALLLTLFAAIALVLAVTGLYGVVSYSVAQRTREIGLRIALGAEPGGILRLILRSGLMLSIRGTVLGLVCSIGLTRFMSSVLFEVSATDPFVFGVVSVLLTAVALGACYLPARKAALIEPAEALRRH